MERPILQLGDPRLRQPAAPVADVADPGFQAEAAALIATLCAFRARHGFGRAIAAPQVGFPRRLIAVSLAAIGRGQGEAVLVDPHIERKSAATFTLWDDCMSFPDLLVRLRRCASVDVAFLDADGRRQIWRQLDRPASELLQHEIDHLDGILAVDRAEGEDAIVTRAAFAADPERYRRQVDLAPAL